MSSYCARRTIVGFRHTICNLVVDFVLTELQHSIRPFIAVPDVYLQDRRLLVNGPHMVMADTTTFVSDGLLTAPAITPSPILGVIVTLVSASNSVYFSKVPDLAVSSSLLIFTERTSPTGDQVYIWLPCIDYFITDLEFVCFFFIEDIHRYLDFQIDIAIFI